MASPLIWYTDNVAWMTAMPFIFSFLLALQLTSFLNSYGLTIGEFEVTRGVVLYKRRSTIRTSIRTCKLSTRTEATAEDCLSYVALPTL